MSYHSVLGGVNAEQPEGVFSTTSRPARTDAMLFPIVFLEEGTAPAGRAGPLPYGTRGAWRRVDPRTAARVSQSHCWNEASG